MGNRLSYSQLRLFQECGKKYDYYYNQKLREKNKSGALFFGSAIDKAIEHCLKFPDKNEVEVFDSVFTNGDINGKVIYIPECTQVVYANSDFDQDLLTEEDIKFICAKRDELLGSDKNTNWLDSYEECLLAKKQQKYKRYTEQQNKYLNLCNWLSLRRKGYLILVAHREKVLPQITKLESTQVKIELTNGTNDSLVGYADMVCYWGKDKEPSVWDYKTSSIEYDEDSVKTSSQLVLYAHALGLKAAGYIVFRKGIKKNRIKICSKCGYDGSGSRAATCTKEIDNKRCSGAWRETIRPEVDIQIIQDSIPARSDEIILDNVEAVNKAIQAGAYSRNFDSCTKAYGKCPYFSLCWEGKEINLEKVK